MAKIIDSRGAERVLGVEALALDSDRGSGATIHGSGRSWALVGRGLRVNGWAVAAGIVVLADADEISVAGERFVFSTWGSAEPFVWPAGSREVCCPRCQEPLGGGDRVVRCPNGLCELVHHDGPDRPCWTKGGCAVCGAPPVDHHTHRVEGDDA